MLSIVSLYATRFGAVFLQSLTFFVVASLTSLESFGEFIFLFAASRMCAAVLDLGAKNYLLREVALAIATGDQRVFARYLIKILRSSVVLAFLILCFYSYFLTLPLLSDDLSSVSIWSRLKRITADNSEYLNVLYCGYAICLLEITISVLRNTNSASVAMLWSDCMPFLIFLAIFGVAVTIGIDISSVVMISALGLAFFLCSFLALMFVVRSIRKMDGKWISLSWDKDIKRDYFAFWGINILGVSMTQLDMLIAKTFLSEWELGVYSLFRKITNLISMPQIVSIWAINTRIATQYQNKDMRGLADSARKGLYLSVPLATILLMSFFLLMPIWPDFFNLQLELLVLVAFIILAFGQYINVLYGANLLFANQCRQEHFVWRYRLIAVLTGAFVMSLGAYIFGLVGMALGVCIPILIQNVLISNHVKQAIGIWVPVALFHRIHGKEGDAI